MRLRTLATVTILVAVGALAAMLFLTRQDDRTRNDALLFLDRYEALDVDDPLETRRPLVEALAAMPFAAAEVDRVRDGCVEAHRTLILAEERGAEAREIFDRATEGGRVPEGDIPTEVRASIEAALSESNEALPRARAQLRECMDGARGLSVRFQPRRQSHR